MEAEFLHKPLRLNLARLELQGTQESQKQMHTSKLPQNPKIRIATILGQFWDKATRYSTTMRNAQTKGDPRLTYEASIRRI
jgi:hypothetical protein